MCDEPTEQKIEIATIDPTKFNLPELYTHVFGDDDKLFIQDFRNGTIYDLNGNLIEELNGAGAVKKIGDNLLLVKFYDLSENKILDYDYNVVYDLGKSSLYFVQNLTSDMDYFAINYIGTAEEHLYELRTYKEENKTNHNFNNNDLTFTFSGKLEKLNSVKINDVELDETKYTKSSGSTIITLKKEYLSTLSKGTYTLKVGYTDGGNASAIFEIPEVNPQTSDKIMNSILLGTISLLGIAGCVVYLNKRKDIIK